MKKILWKIWVAKMANDESGGVEIAATKSPVPLLIWQLGCNFACF